MSARPPLRSGAGVALLLAALLAACTRADAPPSTGAALPPPTDAAELIRPLETWGGAGGTVRVQSTMRATTAEEWQTLWRLAGLRPPRPLAVGREVASGVFLGERPTGGFVVEIVGLKAGAGRSPLVWRERTPPEDALVTQAVTRPWQIAVFPAETIPTGFSDVR